MTTLLGMDDFNLSGMTLPSQAGPPFGLNGQGDFDDGVHGPANIIDCWKTILDTSKHAIGVWRVFDLVLPGRHIVHDIARAQQESDDDWAHASIDLHLKMSQTRMEKPKFNIDITIFHYNGTNFFLASATSDAVIRDQVIDEINAVKEGTISADSIRTLYCYDASSAMDIAMEVYGKVCNSLATTKDVIYLMRLMRAMDIIINLFGREDSFAGYLDSFIGDLVLSERYFERASFPETCKEVRALCGRCNADVKQAGEKAIDAMVNDFQTMTMTV